jgi:hypothetical protein
MGAGGWSETSVPSAISGAGGAGVEGTGPTPGGGGAGWDCGATWVESVPGGMGGGDCGCEEGLPMVQAPSTQTHPPLPWTQCPPVQTALGEGGISQWPAIQTQRWATFDQWPAIQTYPGPGEAVTCSPTALGGES